MPILVSLRPDSEYSALSEKPKDPGIPNNLPFKDQILEEIAEERRQVRLYCSSEPLYVTRNWDTSCRLPKQKHDERRRKEIFEQSRKWL